MIITDGAPVLFFIYRLPWSCLLLGFLKVSGEWLSDERGTFDVRGAVVYGASILCLCLGFSTLPSPFALIFLACSLYGIRHFIKWERAIKHPLFDMTLFVTNRMFTFSCYASFLIYTAVFANIILVSFYAQYLKGMSATVTGAIMMIQPLTMALLSPLMGRLSDRIEPRLITSAGMLLTAAGLFMLTFLNADTPVSYLIVALFVTGFGFSLFSSPNANAIMSAVGKQNYGSATSSLATMRILGHMSSMALVTLVFAVVIGKVNIEPAIFGQLQHAINLCFFIFTGVCLFGMMFSLARGHRHPVGDAS